MNERIAPRKSFVTEIIFEDEFGHEFLYFWSENISASGLFIRTDLALKSGTKVFLKFRLKPNSVPIRTTAIVMRQHGQKRGPGRKKPVMQGVGLKFTSLGPKDFIKLQEFSAPNTL